MANDRDSTLRKAETFLRAGRLDAAIAEYSRVVDDQPKDWSTTNILGDLYARAGQADKAIGMYRRIADHLVAEGFYPKAGALLKKVLKIRPDDESALVTLGDLSARQGLVAEAKGYYTTVASHRSARGDADGAGEMALKLDALEPAGLTFDEFEADVADPVVAAIMSLGHEPAAPHVPAVISPADAPPDPPEAAAGPVGSEVPLPPAASDGPPRPAPSSIPEIDLTGALLELKAAPSSETTPAPVADLEDVFATLRAESDADPEIDEGEEYLSLACTLVETGARDEAIQALLAAVKSPKHRFVCASMLAQLYRDNGDILPAIEWYERAAEAPPTTAEDGRKLMYDLGDLLDTVGETARALAVFMEIGADAPGFLDVADRIRRLNDQVGG